MFAKDDELRHVGAAVEAWWWWGRGLDPAGRLALAWFVGLELAGPAVHYWAGLARRGEPYLYVEDLDGRSLRQGLEIKPPEMWAGHDCDVPFSQWSLGNEAHGVLLADPGEVRRRPFGDRTPITSDIEWYACGEPETVDVVPGALGYRQRGEFDARFETADGVIAAVGAAGRIHVWGAPWRPPLDAALPADIETGSSLRLPYRRSDGTAVEQVVTPDGWWARTVQVA